MQRPKNEGLGTAFGSGAMDSLLGTGTTNVLASATRWQSSAVELGRRISAGVATTLPDQFRQVAIRSPRLTSPKCRHRA